MFPVDVTLAETVVVAAALATVAGPDEVIGRLVLQEPPPKVGEESLARVAVLPVTPLSRQGPLAVAARLVGGNGSPGENCCCTCCGSRE